MTRNNMKIFVLFFLILILIFSTAACNASDLKNFIPQKKEPEVAAEDENEKEEEQEKKPVWSIYPPEDIAIGETIMTFTEIKEPEWKVDLKYTAYQPTYTYFLVNGKTSIHENPSSNSAVIGSATRNQRLNYLNTLYIKTSDTTAEKWYEVKNDKLQGYVHPDNVLMRTYKFDRAAAAIRLVDSYFKDGKKISYISNYKNCNGRPPEHKNGGHDEYGTERSQSAPAYRHLNRPDEFIYLGEGSLIEYVRKIDQGMVLIRTVPDGRIYYVPEKYIPSENALEDFTKAIVIDRGDQNEMVFEKIDGDWTIVSYSLATTGTVSQYAQPTPLGYYFAAEKKPSFDYVKDGTNEIEGYAPYAIRFNGSAYIHGVPMKYGKTESGARMHRGTVDYSFTIGTIPLSHKCVRNYTSHAKFLYDWYELGKTIVIVIE